MNPVTEFEIKVAEWFGAPFGVAVQSCTTGIEALLRYYNVNYMEIPKRTYLSIPMLGEKLNIDFDWSDKEWEDYYCLNEEHQIYDAAVLWAENSYIPGTKMVLSFQFQKHLNTGGGMILLDNEQDAKALRKFVMDGRDRNTPWREQNIETFGIHSYMNQETAEAGLKKLEWAKATPPRKWAFTDWPILTEMDVFK